MPKKKEYVEKALTCYTIIRKKNGYFSLIKLKAKEFDILKDTQENTQEQVMMQVEKEFRKIRIELLNPENKNDDGTASV